MSSDYGLDATEDATARHISGLNLDLAAAGAVSSVYRAPNAVRNHLTNTVLAPHG